MWAVLPLLSPWNGDMRRNGAPYVLTGGLTADCLNVANMAKRILTARGIACYVEVME